MRYLCIALALVAATSLWSQDLPGTVLPGTSTTVTPEANTPPAPGAPVEEAAPEKPKMDPATVQALKNVIKTNVEGMGKRNINFVLSTFHPESPLLESSKDMLTYMFARVQLRYTLQAIEVKKIDGDEAEVEVLQVTQKLSGNAAFRDNRIKLLHTLKQDGKKWKIYTSEALYIEYLKY